VSAAKNVGVQAAKGKYIIILDSDDFFDEHFCTKAIDIFDSHKNIKNVTCYGRWFWKHDGFKIFHPEGGDLKNFLLYNASIGNSMYRREDFFQIGGYDEEMKQGYEDWEYFIRLHEKGGITYVIPE